MTRPVRLLTGLALGLALVLGGTLGTAGPAGAFSPTPRLAPTAGGADLLPARLLVQRLVEDQVVALTNGQRRAHGCAPLRTNRNLRKAARGHTVTMALAGTMSHQLPGEPYFSVRITRAGYTGWRLVAENVARGFGSARLVVRAWMNSPAHRRNILNCRLREIGVGVVLQGGQLWWTQNFGRR